MGNCACVGVRVEGYRLALCIDLGNRNFDTRFFQCLSEKKNFFLNKLKSHVCLCM